MRSSWMARAIAFAAWALAVTGAAGLAYFLSLDRGTSLILIGTVAIVSLFGSFLPILRLASRSAARQDHSEICASQKSNSQR
ncbi:MAG: hypothetical protein ACM3JD_09815 [Rudaea sp.]